MMTGCNRDAKRKNTLINIALLLFAVFVASCISEFILRQLPVSDVFAWAHTPSLQRRLAKFNLNAKVKIVALGDSFVVWQTGKGTNMFDHIQRYFLKKDYAILNLAVSGTDVDGYISTYEKYIHFKPDCIIMCVYLGNDVQNYSSLDRTFMVDSSHLPGQKWKIFLKRHSVLSNLAFRFLKKKFHFLRSGIFENNIKVLQKSNKLTDTYIQNRIKQIDYDILEKAKSDSINPWILANGITNPTYYKQFFSMQSQYAYIAADNTVKIINEFYTKKGIPIFFIVLLPDNLQVSKEYDNFYKKCGFGLDNFPLQERRKLTEYLKTELNKLGIKVIDITSGLEKEIGNGAYINYDIHLNAIGHKIASNMIIDIMKPYFKVKPETTR